MCLLPNWGPKKKKVDSAGGGQTNLNAFTLLLGISDGFGDIRDLVRY